MGSEDFVSLEMAKILKDKGFDIPCFCQYTDKGTIWRRLGAENFNAYDTCCSCPTLYEVHKWLRDKKHVYIEVIYMCDNYWYYDIWLILMNKKLILKDSIVEYESYEDALKEGISDVLEIIK